MLNLHLKFLFILINSRAVYVVNSQFPFWCLLTASFSNVFKYVSLRSVDSYPEHIDSSLETTLLYFVRLQGWKIILGILSLSSSSFHLAVEPLVSLKVGILVWGIGRKIKSNVHRSNNHKVFCNHWLVKNSKEVKIILRIP